MNVISIASWDDTELENGYDTIESNNLGVNSLRRKIRNLVMSKNRSHKKPIFGFFRRTK
jgi:hypothetical protein